MGLRILVDADTQDRDLIRSLRTAGHNVLTANEAGLRTADDQRVLQYAQSERSIVLTQNAEDFEDLHFASADHSGILVIYRSQDRSKDMTLDQVVRAIHNLEAAEIPLLGQFLGLNGWHSWK